MTNRKHELNYTKKYRYLKATDLDKNAPMPGGCMKEPSDGRSPRSLGYWKAIIGFTVVVRGGCCSR